MWSPLKHDAVPSIEKSALKGQVLNTYSHPPCPQGCVPESPVEEHWTLHTQHDSVHIPQNKVHFTSQTQSEGSPALLLLGCGSLSKIRAT